jgi:oligopeptide transport system ATP-binding protein
VSTPLVECIGVSKSYTVARGGQRYEVAALDDVSIAIAHGETLGVVGESGSGKSTLGQIAAALVAPTSGVVRYAGERADDPRRRRDLRRRLQVVWQDPFSSMNVRDTIETIVTEAPIAHGMLTRARRRVRAEEIVASVGLPTDVVRKRPSQLSGGQLQRVAIGRALALEPELLICDEVTSALDVSMQAQILNLLYEVQQRTKVAYLFISHDLAVVKHISDKVAVMYAGRIVETGPSTTVYNDPQHPYTRELVRVSHVEPMALTLAGDRESLDSVAPEGCSYRKSCPIRQSICDTVRPWLATTPSGAAAACHMTHRG